MKTKSKNKKKTTPSGAEVFGDRSQLAAENTAHSIRFVVSNMLQGKCYVLLLNTFYCINHHPKINNTREHDPVMQFL